MIDGQTDRAEQIQAGEAEIGRRIKSRELQRERLVFEEPSERCRVHAGRLDTARTERLKASTLPPRRGQTASMAAAAAAAKRFRKCINAC